MRSGAKRTSYDGLHTVNASERNAPQATESDSHARLRVYKVRCAATLVPNLNVFITLSPLLYLPRTAAQRERLHFRAHRSAQLRPLPSYTIRRTPPFLSSKYRPCSITATAFSPCFAPHHIPSSFPPAHGKNRR